MEALALADEEKRVGSHQADQKAWALAAAVAAYQKEDVVEVAEDAARRQAQRARQAGDEGSNTVDLGWGDDLL
jgi:hypothetical protein